MAFAASIAICLSNIILITPLFLQFIKDLFSKAAFLLKLTDELSADHVDSRVQSQAFAILIIPPTPEMTVAPAAAYITPVAAKASPPVATVATTNAPIHIPAANASNPPQSRPFSTHSKDLSIFRSSTVRRILEPFEWATVLSPRDGNNLRGTPHVIFEQMT